MMKLKEYERLGFRACDFDAIKPYEDCHKFEREYEKLIGGVCDSDATRAYQDCYKFEKECRMRAGLYDDPTIRAFENYNRIYDEERRRLFEAHRPHSDALQQIFEANNLISQAIKDSSKLYETYNAAMGNSKEAIINNMLTKSIYMERMIGDIQWNSIGSAFNASPSVASSLINDFNELSSKYNSFAKYIDEIPNHIITYSPFLLDIPPRELYNAAKLLEISDIESSEYDDEMSDDFQVVNRDASLTEKLSEIDANLAKLLDGAKLSAKSKNPDRGRHVSISLRELITQLLHKLAPDTKIEEWKPDKTDQTYYYKDKTDKYKITRQARLLYICRNINHGSFESFIKKDVSSTITFIEVLNGGTHGVESNFSDEQIKALTTRAGDLISFLIDISNV